MNVPLLHRLRSAGGEFVSLAEFELASISADLDDLERRGFLLERHPYRGVAYRGPSPRLCPDQIEWQLGTHRIGRRVAVWNRVGSTNDLAASAANSSSNDGLVVLAEEQTTGRGRRGRTWTAPPGSSLLMSVLVFPEPPIAGVTWLTALGAVATARVVSEISGYTAQIKWPNDVRVDGRKIAGILVERGLGTVIGIGLNVGYEESSFPESLRGSATSLKILTRHDIDRSELARALIRQLDELYLQGLREGPAALGQLWSDRIEPLGRSIRVTTRAGSFRGDLIQADLDQGLRLVLTTGESLWFPHQEILCLDGEDMTTLGG